MTCSRESAKLVELVTTSWLPVRFARVQRLVQFAPAGEPSAGFVEGTVCRSQEGVVLGFGVFVADRDRPVADPHRRNVSRTGEYVT
jgi:hypothetical protein